MFMLNLTEINRTIDELESGETTFRSCEKLCYLYIVRDHMLIQDDTVQEYNDILPSYNKYCEAKKQFQLNFVPKDYMLQAAQNMRKEIKEFLLTLYHNTETEDERKDLKSMLYDIINNVR